MQSSDVYVTVGLDRKGQIVEVSVNGKPLKPRETPPGLLRKGGSAPGCEEVINMLVHELLTCRKKGDKPRPTPGTTDPCCIRDPQTGRVWCWC
jgi:hypothetical protein